MTGFPQSPRLNRGGIVLVDPDTSQVMKIIALQYNPDTINRTLQVQGKGAESGDRMEALRLKGPAVETIKLEAEIDATDQFESPDDSGNNAAIQHGIYPQLAALEVLVYPTVDQLLSNNNEAKMGTIEIIPMETPLTLFVWSNNRVIPIRITDFSISEEAFDTYLNPIRAKVSLGFRVLSVNDLGFDNKGGDLFLAYLRQKETLAGLSPGGTFLDLGIEGI